MPSTEEKHWQISGRERTDDYWLRSLKKNVWLWFCIEENAVENLNAVMGYWRRNHGNELKAYLWKWICSVYKEQLAVTFALS